MDKYELRIIDKIENRDKSNKLGFASTSSILLKINDFEAYAFLNSQYGGRLTVAEVPFLEKELERKKNDDKLAEMFIENWKILSSHKGITRNSENDTRRLAKLSKFINWKFGVWNIHINNCQWGNYFLSQSVSQCSYST